MREDGISSLRYCYLQIFNSIDLHVLELDASLALLLDSVLNLFKGFVLIKDGEILKDDADGIDSMFGVEDIDNNFVLFLLLFD
jgi:hypothetical protein